MASMTFKLLPSGHYSPTAGDLTPGDHSKRSDGPIIYRVDGVPSGITVANVANKLRQTTIQPGVYAVHYDDLGSGRIVKVGQPAKYPDHPFEAARLAADMTQVDFVAAVFGVDRSTYQRWISGAIEIPQSALLAFKHWSAARH